MINIFFTIFTGLSVACLVYYFFKREYRFYTRLNTKKEYIICSAIWYYDLEPININISIDHLGKCINTDKGIVIGGYRHCSIIHMMSYLGIRTADQKYIQGFITSHNRFLDREEAYELAKKNKLPLIGYSFKNKLFSENLY